LNIRNFIVYLSITLFSWVISSCSSGKKENGITEGQIEYSAEVVDENHPLAGLAPASATMTFKDSKLLVEMSTMGIFNTSFISDPRKGTLSQLVKFMDMKNACIETAGDLAKDEKDYSLTFEPSKDIKTIAGYSCKKVVATMANNPAESFDVYYTEEIDGDSINSLGPYRAIKGMLMDYRLKKLGLEMHFTATSVKKEPIADNVFEVPAYYKIVTRDEMDKVFADILK
jgi:GLPGLI family protein